MIFFPSIKQKLFFFQSNLSFSAWNKRFNVIIVSNDYLTWTIFVHFTWFSNKVFFSLKFKRFFSFSILYFCVELSGFQLTQNEFGICMQSTNILGKNKLQFEREGCLTTDRKNYIWLLIHVILCFTLSWND